MRKKHDHQADLEALGKTLSDEGFSVSTQQSWLDSVHQTIIAAQQAEGCGLIVKRHTPDNPLKKALLTPDDWKLLRYSPVPVLMVKTDTPWAGCNILAAVDVGNADGPHRALHASIVSHGYEIAQMAQCELHVVGAHPSPMLSAATQPSSSKKPSRHATGRTAKSSRTSSPSVPTACTSRKAG